MSKPKFPPRDPMPKPFATLDDVASLSSYHVGDLHSQLRELVDIKATRIRPPHPA